MKIDYEITVRDDLNAEQTYREWKFDQPLYKWIFRGFIVYLCVVSFYVVRAVITNFSEAESIYIFWLGLFNLVGGILYFYFVNPQTIQSFWYKKATDKKHKEYYHKQNHRSITITEQEFIFATQNYEQAWKWLALKYIYEGTNGFMLSFFQDRIYFFLKEA